nr:MAG TPA: hypothetical protein [Caudoviricetes sp.]
MRLIAVRCFLVYLSSSILTSSASAILHIFLKEIRSVLIFLIVFGLIPAFSANSFCVIPFSINKCLNFFHTHCSFPNILCFKHIKTLHIVI